VGGQFIYVYTGLIDSAESDDELAFILGHEISHSLLKHSLRRSEDFSTLLANITDLGSALSRSAGRKETLGLVGGAIRSAYSREDEREADALGAYIAKRASYDPARGIAFFVRLANRENSINAQNQAQLSTAKQNVEQQNANCQNLQNQWNSQPRIRTPQNAQIVNSTCQNAQVNTQKYNAVVKQYSGGQLRSALLATHPADQDRMTALAATTDYLNGRRTLDSLSGIGQGYNVFLALGVPQPSNQARADAIPTPEPTTPASGSMSPPASVAETEVAEAMQKFGLSGTWSYDCAATSGPNSRRNTYRALNNEVPTYDSSSAGSQGAKGQIVSAKEIGDDKLRIRISTVQMINGVETAGSLTHVYQSVGSKFKVLQVEVESRGTTTLVTVDGKFQGKDLPLLERCSY
jgi:hypothetical protein